MITNRHQIRLGILGLPLGLFSLMFVTFGCGSSTWLRNGLLDPGQVGNFSHPLRLEIRESMSLLEEPAGIEEAEEPKSEDAVVSYEDDKIEPGDIIRVSIFELQTPGQSTDQQIQVRNSGFETIPTLGPVKIAGMTVRELELDLKEQLREKGLLDDADVQVAILRSAATQFTIIGPVTNPGNYPLPRPDYRLLNAIATAGGVPPLSEKAYVIREGAPVERGSGIEDEAYTRREAEDSDEDPDAITMSEFSDRGAAPASKPTTRPLPTTVPRKGSAINELEILEGHPIAKPVVPEYNPETEEWILWGAKTPKPTPAPANKQGPTGTSPAAESEPTTQREGAEPKRPEPTPKTMTSQVRVIEIPIKPLLQGQPRYNVVIRPHDLIIIPPGQIGEYYMGGNVARPGVFSLTGREITIKQAIVSAGGFSPLAWPSRADLIRRVSKEEEQIIQIDLDAIFAGKAPDFYLRPNDVINVGTSAAAPFLAVLRNAFRLTYGFGFVYDRNFGDKDAFGARQQEKTRRFNEAQSRGIPF